MSRSLFAACISCLLLSAPVGAPARPRVVTPQELVVMQLYKDFSWEVVMSYAPSAHLIDQPPKLLEKYFDDKIISLLVRDRECAQRQGMCRLDFSPLWASNNPAASRLDVQQNADPGVVSVSFLTPGSNQRIGLTYQLSRGARGWRISDIRSTTPAWSLLSILSSKTEAR